MATVFLVPKNNAASALTAGVSDSAVSLPVTDASLFPVTFPFHVSIDGEIVKVDGVSANNLTLSDVALRGQEGTTAASHLSGAAVELLITAKAVSDLNAAVNALEALETVSNHEGGADPHPGYQRESEKGAASGYASLGADSLVPQDQLGSGAQDGTKFLRDDGSWQVPAGGGLTVLNKTADQINATVTAVDVSDLIVALTAGQILHFRAYLVLDANADTTGIQLAINGPAIGAGQITCTIVSWTSATAFVTSGITAYETFVNNTASPGTTRRIHEIHGIIVNGANAGNFALRFRSEVAVANAVVCRKGSWMQYFLT